MNQVLSMVVGFVLTTVLGGLFGFCPQQRAWKHQTEQRLMEQQLRRADELCQSLSRLHDKRLRLVSLKPGSQWSTSTLGGTRAAG
jgi:uncharacterized protein YjeT (DUF2065 family)